MLSFGLRMVFFCVCLSSLVCLDNRNKCWHTFFFLDTLRCVDCFSLAAMLCMCQFSVDRWKFMCYARMLLHAWHLQKLNACYQEFQHHWISMSIGALHFNTQLSRQIKWTLWILWILWNIGKKAKQQPNISSKPKSSSLPYRSSNLFIMAVRFASDTFRSQCNGVQISQASFFRCTKKHLWRCLTLPLPLPLPL